MVLTEERGYWGGMCVGIRFGKWMNEMNDDRSLPVWSVFQLPRASFKSTVDSCTMISKYKYFRGQTGSTAFHGSMGLRIV